MAAREHQEAERRVAERAIATEQALTTAPKALGAKQEAQAHAEQEAAQL